MASALSIDHLQGLLRERGFAHSLPWRGAAPAKSVASTGVAALDELLDGGLARGRIHEISGALSSGCTATALAMVAASTQRGEATAYIDATDNFHPPTAEQAGIDLSRLLLVRCQRPHEAWDAVNLVVGAGGFGFIVLDLMGLRSRRFLQGWQARPWMKLQHAIENTPATMLVVASHKGIAAHAVAVRVEFHRKKTRWEGQADASFVLDGMQVEAEACYQRFLRMTRHAAQREQRCTFELRATGEPAAPDAPGVAG